MTHHRELQRATGVEWPIIIARYRADPVASPCDVHVLVHWRNAELWQMSLCTACQTYSRSLVVGTGFFDIKHFSHCGLTELTCGLISRWISMWSPTNRSPFSQRVTEIVPLRKGLLVYG